MRPSDWPILLVLASHWSTRSLGGGEETARGREPQARGPGSQGRGEGRQGEADRLPQQLRGGRQQDLANLERDNNPVTQW